MYEIYIECIKIKSNKIKLSKINKCIFLLLENVLKIFLFIFQVHNLKCFSTHDCMCLNFLVFSGSAYELR